MYYVLTSSLAPNLALEHLSRFPPSAILHKDREAILDTIVGFVGHEPNHPIDLEDGKRKAVLDSPSDLTLPRFGGGLSILNVLPLAIHLMESPNLTSRLCTDPRVIFNIANRFDEPSAHEHSADLRKASNAVEQQRNEFPSSPTESYEHPNLIILDQLRNLEALMSAVFKQVASDSNVERRQEYWTEFLKQLRRYCNNEDDLWQHTICQNGWYGFGSCSIIYTLLSTIGDLNAVDMGVRSLAVTFLRLSTERFQQGINLVEASDLVERHVFYDFWYALRTMNLDLVAKIHGADHGNTTLVDGDNDGRECRISNSKLRELFLDGLHLHQSDAAGRLPKGISHQIEIEAYRLLARTSDWDEAFDVALFLSRRRLSSEEYSGVLLIWLNFVMSEESPSNRRMALERLWRDEPDKQTLAMLHVVITALEPLREEKNKCTTIGTFLESLLPKLCGILRNVSTVGEFCCSAASIQTILRTKVRIHLFSASCLLSLLTPLSDLDRNSIRSRQLPRVPH